MGAIRHSIAGLILIAYFFFHRKYIPTLKQLLLHFVLGFFSFTMANGLTTWSIKYIPSGLGALLGCLFPFMLLLLNSILYKEKVNLKSSLGLLVGFTGVGIIFYSYIAQLFQTDFSFGILLCLFGVFSWTIGTLVSSRQVLKGNNLSGIGYQMFFGGMQLFVFSYLRGEQVVLAEISHETWYYLTYLIAIGSILCFLCYMYVLKNLPTEVSGIYAYFNPIVALFLGVIILDEPLTKELIIGTLVVLIGVYLVKRFSTTAKKQSLD